MSVEVVEHDGTTYAEILRAGVRAETTRFFSPAGASFQFGLLAHGAGFLEPAHIHKPISREIADLSQMFVVQRGVVEVDFYDPRGRQFETVTLFTGDAIVLCAGAHALRAVEDFQAVTVKQGPFMGDQNDKLEIVVAEAKA